MKLAQIIGERGGLKETLVSIPEGILALTRKVLLLRLPLHIHVPFTK